MLSSIKYKKSKFIVLVPSYGHLLSVRGTEWVRKTAPQSRRQHRCTVLPFASLPASLTYRQALEHFFSGRGEYLMHGQARSSSDPQQNPRSLGEAAMTLAGCRQSLAAGRESSSTALGGKGRPCPRAPSCWVHPGQIALREPPQSNPASPRQQPVVPVTLQRREARGRTAANPLDHELLRHFTTLGRLER